MGIELSRLIFQTTRSFPPEERYSLTSQLIRCAISIPSNIAEGCGRNTSKDLNRFLSISLGSAFELETQIILAYEFGYIDKDKLEIISQQIIAIQKMISGLRKTFVN